MRFTVVDPRGRVSFIAPCATLEALVAACASDTQPRTIEQFLKAAEPFVGDLAERVLSGVDPRTEEISLSPVRAGVVVFNLLAKRIVQLQNTYSEIRRKGRVRVLRNNQPTDRVHRYELPEDWSLVPSRTTS